jgi:ribosome-binding factor A
LLCLKAPEHPASAIKSARSSPLSSRGTITHVKVSPDLQQARVFYTTIGDEKARRESARALDRATPFLKRHVGQRLQLKRVPELAFVFDEAFEKSDRIERILHQLNTERAETPAQAEDTTEPPDDD